MLSGPWGEGVCPSEALSRALPYLNHQADLYVFLEDPIAQWEDLSQVLELVSRFLSECAFMRIQIRPVHPVSAGRGAGLRDMYRVISAMGSPFHAEALAHQVASRWMVLPVLRARFEQEVEEALELVPFLRERMILPSLSLPPSPRLGQWRSRLELDQERLLIEDARSPLENIFCHDLLDELLGWALSSKGGFSVEPCGALILDSPRGQLLACPWQEGRALGEGPEISGGALDPSRCLGCWDELPSRMEDVIRWNRREEEGARVCHQLGVFAMARGHRERAVAHLETALRLASDAQLRAESLLYLGILRLEQGRTQEASELLGKALSLTPGSGTILYHLARCEFSWKDFIAAAELFQDALKAGVGNELRDELLLQLAICRIHLEEFVDAWEVLEDVGRTTAPVCFYRGMALLGQGRASQAMEFFRQALDLGPEDEDKASVLFYLGHCLKELGQFQEASIWLQKALEADPRSYEAWNLLGYCLFKLGLHHQAIGAFLKALEIRPGSAIDFANIGSNLRDLGDKEGAVQWYRKALTLDPTLGFAADNLRKLEKES